MKSVSLVIPCSKGRGWLLDKTLASITRQRYPGQLEIIVVEDGYDAHILSICQQHQVRHIKCLRAEAYPEFQNPAKIRNMGIKAAKNEILMIQDSEIIHTSPTVLQDLVNRVGENREVMATAILANLDKDGKFAGWYNHPGPPKYGIMGGCLQAIYRDTVLAMGGFEESFFGYGYEDNFYVWMLGKNKIDTCFVDTALTEHQWHPKTLFEPFTGNANRALAWTLVAEIEWEGRPPIANYRAPTSSDFVESYDTVAELIRAALEIFHEPKYTAWAEDWLTGKNISHDASFEARDIASAIRTDAPDNISIPAYVAMKAAEAAWAVRWAAICYEESVKFRGRDVIWMKRLLICRQRHLALASVAIRTGKRVLAGELPRA
jgi:glycosyltransferase involved in cell wall biosynthesis